MGAATSKTGPGFTAWWLGPLLVWLALVLPAHPDKFNLQSLLVLPLELPLVILAIVLLPGGFNKAFRLLLVAFLLLLVLLRLADVGSYIAFDRRFSPLVEWHLLGDGWNLASSSVGRGQAALAVVVLALIVASIVWLLSVSLKALSHLLDPYRRRLTNASLALLVCIGAVLIAEHLMEQDWPVSGGVPTEARWRVQNMYASIQDQTEFVRALAEDPVLDVTAPAFTAIAERDVLILFVESYGRSFIDLEPMRSTALPRLAQSDAELADAGLSRRSGWVESPIRGGRSWLAHATFMSGLLVDNQARFDRLISSERVSLNRLFARAGWHTAGLMPAIKLAWPEGAWYGFDTTLDSRTLGYEGEPFGWVTMPDQYTLHALQQLRERTDKPLMAEVALISSHVPWTPIANIVPWDAIDDGRVFDGSQRDEPPIVWKDRAGVQVLYNRSLDYSLQVTTEYAARYADNALIIVIGDHQPASIIDGWGKTADVPIHIISNDEALLSRLPEASFSNGMVPDSELESVPMQDIRLFLSRIFEVP